jgi:hypothetical protein
MIGRPGGRTGHHAIQRQIERRRGIVPIAFAPSQRHLVGRGVPLIRPPGCQLPIDEAIRRR